MKALGICVGASTITMAGLEHNGSGGLDARRPRRAPPRKPPPAPYRMLNGIDASRYDRVSVTGSTPVASQPLLHPRAPGRGAGPASTSTAADLETVSAPAARRSRLRPRPRRRISTVHTGNKCASGRASSSCSRSSASGWTWARRRGLPGLRAPPRFGPLQRLLQERLYACGQQGRVRGEDRGGPVPDDDGEDRRDPPPGAPRTMSSSSAARRERHRHRSPAQEFGDLRSPTRLPTSRPSARHSGPSKTNGTVPRRREALPATRRVPARTLRPWRTSATGSSSSPRRGGSRAGNGSSSGSTWASTTTRRPSLCARPTMPSGRPGLRQQPRSFRWQSTTMP